MKLPVSLISIAPIGVGTPLVESLYSYVLRLAKANKVTFWDLMGVLDEASEGALHRTMNGGLNWIHALYSFGDSARVIVNLIHKLTGRNDLTGLLISLMDGFIEPFLWKKCHTFLPASKLGYEPLLYSIDGVFWDPCGDPLSSTCPDCLNKCELRSEYHTPGICMRCNNRLDRYDELTLMALFAGEQKENQKAYGVWAAQQVGELLSCGRLVVGVDLHASFQCYLNEAAGDNQRLDTLMAAGITDLLLGSNRALYRIHELLKFCHATDIGLVDFVLKKPLGDLGNSVVSIELQS